MTFVQNRQDSIESMSRDTPVTPSTTIRRFPPQFATIHRNLRQSAAICLQSVCNMSAISAICLQYLQYVCNICNIRSLCQAHETPPFSTAKITLPESVCAQHRTCTVLVLCLFTK